MPGARQPGRCATTRCASCSSSRHWYQFGRLKNASMPRIRHRLRSGYSWRSSPKGLDRIRRARLAHLAIIDGEPRLSGGRRLHHAQPQLRRGERLVAVRRIAGGEEADFLEPQRLHKLERRSQVAVVDGIEGAAENPHGVHRIPCLKRAAVAKRPPCAPVSPVRAVQASPAARPLKIGRCGRPGSGDRASGSWRSRARACGEGLLARFQPLRCAGLQPLALPRLPQAAQLARQRPQDRAWARRPRSSDRAECAAARARRRPPPPRRPGTRRSARCRPPRASTRSASMRPPCGAAARASAAPAWRRAGCPRRARRSARRPRPPAPAPGPSGPRGEPSRQRIRLDRPHRHPDAVLDERLHPGRRGGLGVELAGRSPGSPRRAADAARARPSCAAPLSGLPPGMRNSNRRRSANNDRDCAAACSSFQSKPRSTKNTRRSAYPAARAAVRIASAASSTSSGSSPEIR